MAWKNANICTYIHRYHTTHTHTHTQSAKANEEQCKQLINGAGEG
jgi:hypothetical protein